MVKTASDAFKGGRLHLNSITLWVIVFKKLESYLERVNVKFGLYQLKFQKSESLDGELVEWKKLKLGS